MSEEFLINDIADELLILSKYTVETLYKLDNCADCIALYVFYYKTAKWQKTNTIKATDEYIKKSLKWGYDKIRRTKETLKMSGLIDIVQRRKNGKIDGWYIQVNYLISERKLEETKIIVDDKNTQNLQIENSRSRIEKTNALKTNNNCLKNKNEDALRIKEAWNALPSSIPKINSINGAREAHLNTRIKKYGIDKVIEAINLINKSKFLKGNNDRGWVVTFDWFIRKGSFEKIMEGNYTDRKPKDKLQGSPSFDISEIEIQAIMNDDYDI